MTMRARHLYCLLLILAASGSAMAQAPLEYIRNAGQWSGDFRYRTKGGGTSVFLEDNAFTYLLGSADNALLGHPYHHADGAPDALKFFAYRVRFEGANPRPVLKPGKEQKHYYNYFLGNDKSRWQSGIHPAHTVDYEGLYSGIDLHVASDRGQMKYDFMVKPGSDAGTIHLDFEGVESLSLRNGNLEIKTSFGPVTEMRPVAYQYIGGNKKDVRCRYRLNGNRVSFDLPDGYDETALLIIDPTVVFATFTGSVADNWGFTATYDDQGNFYGGGLVSGAGYPATLGAFQIAYAGGHMDLNDSTHGNGYASDIGISKFNPAGTALIYATYIGGADNETPHSMIVDAGGNLVIAGRTYSSDFPTTTGAFDESKNPLADIAVIKLNANGTALVGSSYVGGNEDDGVNFNPLEPVAGNLKYNYGDDARSEVLVDKLGNIYITASTSSTDFPVTPGAWQAVTGGEQDAVFFKMNPSLTTMTYATYLGGSQDDAGYVMALDTAQTHVYVGGGTMSTNFPTAGAGVWKPSYQGGSSDGYIAKFLNSGSYPAQLVTFIGTANLDQVYGLQVDVEDNVYAMGQSVGGQFPVTAGVYSNPNSCQYVVKLPPNLSTNTYSTVFGSGDAAHTNISPVAFLVDTCQNVYISGWGGDLGFTDFPESVGFCTGMPISTPFQPGQQTTTDGSDFYFIVLSKNAINLLYSTYYGRNSPVLGFGEHVDGGTSRFDAAGIVYQAICGNCGGPGSPALPTTPGTYSPTVASNNCNLLALKIAFELGAVKAEANVNPNAKGCPPFTVTFENTSSNATSYEWVFGDGSTVDTTTTPTHTFTDPGVYSVQFIAINPNACKVRDTAYLAITVDTNSVNAAFTATVTDSCGPYIAAVTNTSEYGTTPGAQTFTTFEWLWGDGTSSTGANPGAHAYGDTGYYTIMMIMRDTTACNNPDTAQQTIFISSFRVSAGLIADDSTCLNTTIPFFNASVNGATYFWDFGDGDTSTGQSPIHTYDSTGTYTITFIVTNPAACNFSDTVVKVLTINGVPVADFTFSPTLPIPNEPITFTNLSTNAIQYIWNFGDGSGSIEKDPSHMYRRTGTWTVCLEARNASGCADTVCKPVQSDVQPNVDMPTAFSPNGDGANDILYVRGAAIEKMNLKIWNRFGELVFESNSTAMGWDGTFKSKPQEMDAYAFVLNATFIDGTTAMKKGNVTLIR